MGPPPPPPPPPPPMLEREGQTLPPPLPDTPPPPPFPLQEELDIPGSPPPSVDAVPRSVAQTNIHSLLQKRKSSTKSPGPPPKIEDVVSLDEARTIFNSMANGKLGANETKKFYEQFGINLQVEEANQALYNFTGEQGIAKQSVEVSKEDFAATYRASYSKWKDKAMMSAYDVLQQYRNSPQGLLDALHRIGITVTLEEATKMADTLVSQKVFVTALGGKVIPKPEVAAPSGPATGGAANFLSQIGGNRNVSSSSMPSSNSAGGTKAKDDPVLQPFFKMLKLGVPRGAVEVKMKEKGVDPVHLDLDPDAPSPFESTQSVNQESGGGVGAVKDDPKLQPFFKMLKMGVPKPAVMIKMEQAGLNPSFLELDPCSPSPLGGATPNSSQILAVKDDPKLMPFFKMLKMGVPRPAVEVKVQQAGLDCNVLDLDPDSPSPFANEIADKAIEKAPSGFLAQIALNRKASVQDDSVEQKG